MTSKHIYWATIAVTAVLFVAAAWTAPYTLAGKLALTGGIVVVAMLFVGIGELEA